MFLTQAAGKREDFFWSNQLKKDNLTTLFCLQYEHRYIQTQALCGTNVLPPRSQCTAWHDYCSAAGVFPHHIADTVYTARNREKETCGLERGSVQGVVPVPGCALQRVFQRLSCSPANKARRWWTVSVGLHFHTRETPLLPQTARTLSCPRHLFSPRYGQTSSSGYLQSNQGCDCPQAGMTVQ